MEGAENVISHMFTIAQQVPTVYIFTCLCHASSCIQTWLTLTYFQQYVIAVWLVAKQQESRAVEVESRLYSLLILY